MTKNEKKILFALARQSDKMYDHANDSLWRDRYIHESMAIDSVMMAFGVFQEYHEMSDEQLDTYVREVWKQLYE